LNELDGKIAAVILEPMNVAYPEPGFLESVQIATQKAGALLIFDETITGFRFATGGAQELFGVTPDLSTFGKGMANGFSVAALVGKKEIMDDKEIQRKKLSNLLKSKITEKQICRSGKNQRETVLEKTLGSLGIDKDKFKADLEAIKKQGGLEISMKNGL
jgi:glutamate-1-semialdehyde aminotransferase